MPGFGGYDGTIKIDSRIDTKGFNKGISGMIGALKPLAIAIAAIFGVGQIVRFGKAAVDEASKMASALVGLQSIVEGTGNSFSKAQEFINSYVDDGLIPAQNAITAYKNLLLRGYDTSQIEKTLIALKDSAAFGRQGSLTLGQAVESATEGLKNENSILVDNAGVTKNVSLIWRDYAESIGTTVSALTKQQKIQAEVAGILEETRFQTGDAAKLAGTYAGQVSALSVSVLNLKIAFGNVLIPIIQKFLPIIKAAVDALTVFFNRLATIVSILFGVDLGAARESMEDTAGATQSAADAQGELADNTEAAGKAAKGALASFDELNVLAQDTGTGADAGAAVDTGLGGAITPELDTTNIDEGLDEIRAKVEEWKQGFLEFTKPIRDALENDLFPVLQKLGGQIWEGLVWVWENILVPFGTWLIEEFGPVFIEFIASVLDVWSSTWEALKPVLEDIWENVLQPFFAWLGDVAIKVFEWLTEKMKELKVWIDNNQQTWAAMITVLLVVVAIIAGVLAGGISLIIGLIIGLIYIIANAGKAWQIFKDLISLGAQIIKNAFILAFNTIKEKAISIFENIKSIVKGIINNIIDLINGMISRIANGINSVIYAANTVGSILPGFQGIGYVSAPQIPRLATGAVIPPNASFLAMLGDQKSGRNIEAPEGLIRQIIREEIGNIDANVQIEFTGSMSEIARILNPAIKKENVRIGGSLIKSGVVTR